MTRTGSVVLITLACDSEEDARLLFTVLMTSLRQTGTLGGVEMVNISNVRYTTDEMEH